MKRKIFFTLSAIGIFWLLNPAITHAQSTDVPKYEVAADFTSTTFGAGQNRPGLGGRFSYNLNTHVALEAAGYIFPERCQFCGTHAGRITEGLFGVKVGKRFKKWGIFAKVRPGVLSFGEGQFDIVSITTTPPLSSPLFDLRARRLTAFVVDVGGVLEFYPSRHIVTRIDIGNTIIRYPAHTNTFPFFDTTTGQYVLGAFETRAETRGSFQIMAGVGFRF
jgi:hypothetical protein